jgi:hypothetical protein
MTNVWTWQYVELEWAKVPFLAANNLIGLLIVLTAQIIKVLTFVLVKTEVSQVVEEVQTPHVVVPPISNNVRVMAAMVWFG